MQRAQSSIGTLQCRNGSLLIIKLLLLHLSVARAICAALPPALRLPVCVSVAGLVSGIEPSACAFAQAFPVVSHDAITRMLACPWWSRQLMLGSAVALANALGGGWLILDDVHIPKPYAKAIAFCFWDYDHASRRNAFGLRLVVLVWCNGALTIPLGFFIWQKDPTRTRRRKTRRPAAEAPKARAPRRTKSEKRTLSRQVRCESGVRYRSKNELARALVWTAVRAGIHAEVICFDNWYASRENIKFFGRMGLEWVTSLKKNTRVEFEGRRLTVAEVAATVAKPNYHYYARIAARARCFPVTAFGITAQLTVVKDDSHPDGGHVKYLATSIGGLTAMEHVQWYRRRWPIEVLFRDCKQLLGLCRCQARGAQQQLTHLVLVLVGYVVLQLMKRRGPDAQVSVHRSQHALLVLRVLVTGRRTSLARQHPTGTFEPVDLAHLWDPIRTRLPEQYLPETFALP